MKTESMILNDSQMTNLIHNKTKGDTRHKNEIVNQWLIFTYQTWQEFNDIKPFVEKINKWLHQQKLPIVVTDFVSFNFNNDEEDDVEWHVDVIS